MDLDENDLSIVITAKHNISNKQETIDITSFDGSPLQICDQEFCDDYDIAYFVINGNSTNAVDICHEVGKADAIAYGYPRALAMESKKHHPYEGDIYFEPDHEDDNLFYMNITKGAPSEPSSDYIQGFSGGPIYEIVHEEVKLKGIVTHKIDKIFNIAKVQCHKIKTVLALINSKYKIRSKLPLIDDALFTEIYQELGEDLEDTIFDTKISNKINEIDRDKVFKKSTKIEPLLQLETNVSSTELRINLKKLIKTKAMALIYNFPNISADINANPIVNTEVNKKIFSIKIDNNLKRPEILRNFMDNAESLGLDNSIVITFSSNLSQSFEYLDKNTVSRTLENYNVKNSTLFADLSKKERRETKAYFKDNHNQKTSFSILDLDWLIKKALNLIENKVLIEQEITTDSICEEIRGIINVVDTV